MKTPLFICIALILMAFSCSNSYEPTGNGSLGFYFLKNDDLKIHNVDQMDLNTLELKPEPWLSEKDIEFYDFSTHAIYLKTNTKELLKEYLDSTYMVLKIVDKPFVVIANGHRCYTGSLFHSMASSYSPIGPMVSQNSYLEDVIFIEKSWREDIDIRNHPEIRKALMELNIFHAGLLLRLNFVEVLENADTSTIRYSFTLTNQDTENLLVIDPDKMGSEQFHFFTNGVVFQQGEDYFYSSEFKKVKCPNPVNSWEPVWFSQIKSGHSITRTVNLKGYPSIPEGTYSCYFNFNNPHKIDKQHRWTPAGRYWLGSIQSKEIQVNIN